LLSVRRGTCWSDFDHARRRGHSPGSSARVLLAAGANLEASSVDFGTPLLRTAADGRTEVVRVLLDAGANPKARAGYGKSALHVVKDPESCALLIARGAEVNARNAEDETPLMWQLDSPEVAPLLIKAGADLEARDRRGRTLRDRMKQTKLPHEVQKALSEVGGGG